MYENIIITMLLFVDATSLYLYWKTFRLKERDKLTRKFKKVMRSLNLV